jgi:hypothetical protein
MAPGLAKEIKKQEDNMDEKDKSTRIYYGNKRKLILEF